MIVYLLIREDQNEHGYLDTAIAGIFLEERIVRAREQGLRAYDEEESDPDWQVSCDRERVVSEAVVRGRWNGPADSHGRTDSSVLHSPRPSASTR